MTDATLHEIDAARDETARPPTPRRRDDWPLIADILSARVDHPDLLRRWPDRERDG